MELRFGVNPLKSQSVSKDQSSKSTKSRSKKDARLEGSQKTKDFKKTLKNEPGGKSLDKEVEKLGKKFLFRLPVIRSNVCSEASSHTPSHEPVGRPTPALQCTTTRPTPAPSTEALHIGELIEEEAESERKTPKHFENIFTANRVSVESKYPSKYPASMLIDNSQMQENWRDNLQEEKKVPKEEEKRVPKEEDEKKMQKGEEERKFRRHLSELRPKISALTRSLNSLQVMLNI